MDRFNNTVAVFGDYRTSHSVVNHFNPPTNNNDDNSFDYMFGGQNFKLKSKNSVDMINFHTVSGGRTPARMLIRMYCKNAKGFVYCLKNDKSESHRMYEWAKRELEGSFGEIKKKTPLLVLFDNEGDSQMTEAELIKTLELDSLKRPYSVQICNAATGEGITEGFDKLLQSLDDADFVEKKENPPKLEKIVSTTTKQQSSLLSRVMSFSKGLFKSSPASPATPPTVSADINTTTDIAPSA